MFYIWIIILLINDLRGFQHHSNRNNIAVYSGFMYLLPFAVSFAAFVLCFLPVLVLSEFCFVCPCELCIACYHLDY